MLSVTDKNQSEDNLNLPFEFEGVAWEKIKPIANQILASQNIHLNLEQLTNDLKTLFDCEGVTLYAFDRGKEQIYSLNYSNPKVKEIRLDLSGNSVAGYAASTGTVVHITNVHSQDELSKYSPDLKFDPSWDRKNGFKTRSVLAFPLPYNKKLVGLLEIVNNKKAGSFSEDTIKMAKELSGLLGLAIAKIELENIADNIIATTHAIHSAKNIDEILIGLKPRILELFDASVVTIYVIDHKANEIFSRFKSGGVVNEIRIPIGGTSVAGFVASEKEIVNITDVYDSEELSDIHPSLKFDHSWDKKFVFRTKSMLVVPLMLENKILGVLQLINKRNYEKFNSQDEKNAKRIAQTLALALQNHKKSARKPTKFDYLMDHGLVSQEELDRLVSRAVADKVDVEFLLLKEMELKRMDLGKSLEDFYNIPYQEYNRNIQPPKGIVSGLNKNYLQKNFWVPLSNGGDKVVILINDPTNLDKIHHIRQIFPKRNIEFKVGLKVDILDYLNSISEEEVEEAATPTRSENVTSILSALRSESEESLITESLSREDSEENAYSDSDSTIVKLVSKVITDAYDQGISDIHIEPRAGKKDLEVRFRKDGVCHLYESIPGVFKHAFVSRIKILGRMDIAEKRLPQDGKIKLRYGANNIELRVATFPTVYGAEDVVLRILSTAKPMPLGKINLSERNLKLIKKMIRKPYGLILVVGPTGSGKTTTLHAAVKEINVPEKKIWTAEDPVEITQEGLRQVQVNNKINLTFASLMRSFLRGDPDVIMVGEMRDAETSGIGLEASLTGHLVLSTLHTNSAPETITRLIDMGMNPINFADAMLLILAQRLVRTLCEKCKQSYQPSKEEFDILVDEYGREHFGRLGIKYGRELTLYKAIGCDVCNNTGYLGRTAIHELLESTPSIRRMIMKKALMEDIREQAVKEGMTTLKQDGIWKVFKGECDLTQVTAVCMV